MTRVFINGIDGLLGARVAELISRDREARIIGLGRARPPAPVGRAEWFAARLSGKQFVELLRAEAIEVVVHLDFAGAERPAEDREQAVQQNVIGSMELFGACAAAGVRRIVLLSHVGVYGASALNPAMITEDRPIALATLSGLLRDFAEVEQFAIDFVTRRPLLQVVPLRLASLIGGWSPMVDYLTNPGPRMLVGFDPRIQLLGLDDAAEGFARAALSTVAGPFNLASDDVLRLSQAIRLAGQQPVTVLEPVVELALSLGNHAILGHWPFGPSFLRYSCVVDTQRAKCELGWAPTRSAAELIQMLRANGRLVEDRAQSEAALREFLARRS
ncbi:MAG: NAD-dependent epimerase/dehydratase family protein [Chloroflexaceae bacterium]